jgi:uncharacterized protein (DUF427 family)
MWDYRGQRRPDFAEAPGPGQESVWDYPRPPALAPDDRTVEVREGTTLIARSTGACRVLETASPPTFYLPPDDVDFDQLVRVAGGSWCEWKGEARYFASAARPDGPPVAWAYPSPTPAFATISGWLAFYPGRIECRVDNERVRPQEGGFYGGWVTDEIVGPWKGEPGTGGW